MLQKYVTRFGGTGLEIQVKGPEAAAWTGHERVVVNHQCLPEVEERHCVLYVYSL